MNASSEENATTEPSPSEQNRAHPDNRDFFKKILRWAGQFPERVESDPAFRFHLFSWSLAILFLAVSLLSESNPFRLLIPGLAYEWPARDSRQEVTLYGIERTAGHIQPIRRRVFLDENRIKNSERIAFMLSRPADLEEQTNFNQLRNIEPLPELGFSIKTIWEQTKGGRKGLIIDLRETTIRKVMDNFLKNRGEKHHNYYINSFFSVLTKSLLEVETDINFIEYRLDGKSEKIEESDFPFNRTWERESIDSYIKTVSSVPPPE